LGSSWIAPAQYTRRPMAQEKVAEETDGRRLRAVRTKEAIIDAVLALVDAGELTPTVPQIAERAGISERSIRQHFASRSALLLAGAAKHAERASRLHAAPVAKGSFDVRLDAFVRARVAYLEATAGVRRAAMMHADEWPVLKTAIRALSMERKREVEIAFTPELARLADRDERLEAMHLASSGAVWDGLRRDLGMSKAEAERHLRFVLKSLAKK
jgi:TetR/AcrR family transcriptional regulator, regulator of autoinduction and epiphytic fitness